MTERFGPEQDTLDRVAEQASLDAAYVIFMASAGVLAAVGLLANSVPILVGAMVVAPALAPLALVAFALVAGDNRLALRGLGVAAVGLGIAFAFSLATTVVMNATNVIPPETNLLNKPLLEERVRPGWYAVAAGVAAGIAGTIALNRAKTDTLVGTVAALALVPAVAAAAIAFLSKDPMRGLGGLLLLGVNVALIVAMGIVVLVAGGIAARPSDAKPRAPRRAYGLLGVAAAITAFAVIVLALALVNGYAPDQPPAFGNAARTV